MPTIEDYRLQCGWSKNEMARKANMDFNTLQKVFKIRNCKILVYEYGRGVVDRQVGVHHQKSYPLREGLRPEL